MKWKSVVDSREGNQKEKSSSDDEKEWKFDKKNVRCYKFQ